MLKSMQSKRMLVIQIFLIEIENTRKNRQIFKIIFQKSSLNSSKFLGTCQVPVDLTNQNSKAQLSKTFSSLLEPSNEPQSTTLKFQLDMSQYSHILIKSCVKKTDKIAETNDQKDQIQLSKRRKSNRAEPLGNGYLEEEPPEHSETHSRNNLVENFLVCALKTSTRPSFSLNTFRTESLFDLDLEANSIYTFKMSEATETDKKYMRFINVLTKFKNEVFYIVYFLKFQ